MNKEQRAIEQNMERIQLGLSDEEFAELRRQIDRDDRLMQAGLAVFAALVFIVLLVDPVAETIALVVQNFWEILK